MPNPKHGGGLSECSAAERGFMILTESKEISRLEHLKLEESCKITHTHTACRAWTTINPFGDVFFPSSVKPPNARFGHVQVSESSTVWHPGGKKDGGIGVAFDQPGRKVHGLGPTGPEARTPCVWKRPRHEDERLVQKECKRCEQDPSPTTGNLANS